MRALHRFRAIALLSVSALLVTALHSASVSLPVPEVRASADARPLFLTLSDGVDTVQAGEALTYTVSLRTDSQAMQFYDVTLTLPAFVNLVEASDGGRHEGSTIVWRNVPVTPTVERHLYVSISVDPYAENGATITAEVEAGGERAATSARIVGIATVPYAPTIRLRVSDGKGFAAPEEELRYVITVENDSPIDRTFSLRSELPTLLVFLGATGHYLKDDTGSIRWIDEFLRAGEMRQYEVAGYVERNAPDFANIVFKASVDGYPMSDMTVVQRKAVIDAFRVFVTDGQSQVSPGGELAYEIRLRNEGDVLATDVNVTAALPTYAEFMEATNGGVWTGNNVRWTGLTVSPHGERILRVIAHVRTDAPVGAELRMSAEAKGQVGVDRTMVVAGVPLRAERPREAVLQKVADRSEVRPGDAVTYTVTLRNVTDHPFRNVRVEDRLGGGLLRVISGDAGQQQGDCLVWLLPELLPGQSWSATYTAEVSPRAPHGASIDNVVTVSGEGLETLSLTETVYTTQIGIVSDLPPTGAAFDALFLLFSGIAGVGQTFLLRRKWLL